VSTALLIFEVYLLIGLVCLLCWFRHDARKSGVRLWSSNRWMLLFFLICLMFWPAAMTIALWEKFKEWMRG
jgi:hypothetical protein